MAVSARYRVVSDLAYGGRRTWRVLVDGRSYAKVGTWRQAMLAVSQHRALQAMWPGWYDALLAGVRAP